MVYIFCFIWTILFTYIAEHLLKKENKKKAIFCMFLAILIPSLFAGFRATNVGRDVGAYVTPVVKNASLMNFYDYMGSPLTSYGVLENGYKILIFIIVKLSSSVNFTLFVLQFLTIFFVSLFAYKNRNKFTMTFTMTIYMLVVYCVSYTFMRQCLSIGIILYSITFFEEKKYLKTLLLFLIAFNIHSASIVSLIIYSLLFISSSNISIKNKKKIYILYFIILVICTIFFEQIVFFLSNELAILPTKYYQYTQSYLTNEGENPLSDLIMKILFLILSVGYSIWAKKDKSPIDINIIFLLLCTDFATFILSYKIVNASRVGLYFSYTALFYLIPNINRIFKNVGNVRSLVSAFCVCILIFWWIWKFPIKSWCETWPYRFYNSSNYFLVRK